VTACKEGIGHAVMGEQVAGGNVAIALLASTIATGADSWRSSKLHYMSRYRFAAARSRFSSSAFRRGP
jgi:hypothetical protein